jgi:hypothetical protein
MAAVLAGFQHGGVPLVASFGQEQGRERRSVTCGLAKGKVAWAREKGEGGGGGGNRRDSVEGKGERVGVPARGCHTVEKEEGLARLPAADSICPCDRGPATVLMGGMCLCGARHVQIGEMGCL